MSTIIRDGLSNVVQLSKYQRPSTKLGYLSGPIAGKTAKIIDLEQEKIYRLCAEIETYMVEGKRPLVEAVFELNPVPEYL